MLFYSIFNFFDYQNHFLTSIKKKIVLIQHVFFTVRRSDFFPFNLV